MDCRLPYDFEIGLDEELDYNATFASWLANEGGIQIVNEVVSSSPEIQVTGVAVLNFSRDVIFTIRPLTIIDDAWVKVVVTTPKVLPNAVVQTKEATIVFKIVERRVAQDV